ncbi:MAG: methyltransferase domain-containing protein [Verrucomicrobiae bacterium]|nr:methyltransferase domain-containing protein [Verrucomicrobiae bacterium]
MHPRIFTEFERLCRRYGAGGDVLEIGAVPRPDTLLCLRALTGARSKVGVNISAPCRHADFEIVRADANDLAAFSDRSFDTILCNATLEHDRFFWKTLAEIRRVGKPGAVVMIGVPGFDRLGLGSLKGPLAWLARAGWLGRLRLAEAWRLSTVTLAVHAHPLDFYRFSPDAVREVFMAGMEDVLVRRLMIPPRVIGAGRLPQRFNGSPRPTR